MKLNKNYFIKFILFFLSSFISLYMFINTDIDSGYGFYFIVPFTFGVLNVFCTKINYFNLKFPGMLVLNFTMLIKYLLTPFIMCLGNYYSWLGTMPSNENIHISILLIIVEMISIFTLSNYLNFKQIHNEFKENTTMELKHNLCHFIFIILGFSSLFIIPAAFDDYHFIWDLSNIAETVKVDFDLAGIFKTLFIFARYSLILLIINYFYKRNLKKQSKINIIMSIFPIIINCIYISNLSRINIAVPVFVFSCLIYFLFNDASDRKFITKFLIITLITSTVFMSAIKFFGNGRGNEGNETNIAWWGDTLNMYFSGPKETAIAISTSELVKKIYGYNRLYLMYNDAFSNVIGLSNTTNKMDSTALFNIMYFSREGVRCQIVPNIAEGYLYFGPVLYFLWPLIFVYLCYFYDKKFKEVSTLDLKFAYLYSSIYCGMVLMLNSSMLISNMINVTLLFTILSVLNDKISISKKSR